MKCPICGAKMVLGIYDYGVGNAYCDCWICKKCYHTEVPPMVKSISGSETSIVKEKKDVR